MILSETAEKLVTALQRDGARVLCFPCVAGEPTPRSTRPTRPSENWFSTGARWRALTSRAPPVTACTSS